MISRFFCILITLLLIGNSYPAYSDEQQDLETALKPMTELLQKTGFAARKKAPYASMSACKQYIDEQVKLAPSQGLQPFNLKDHMQNRDVYAYFLARTETEGVAMYCVPWSNKAALIEGDFKQTK